MICTVVKNFTEKALRERVRRCLFDISVAVMEQLKTNPK